MATPIQAPVLVVGAGVAGLSCARALSGLGPVVLDRARGVGGRCATRRLGGQALDYGPSFLHGSSPDFLAALDEVRATPVPGWPLRVRGRGRPCQPEAFQPGERRLAWAEGLRAFPLHLAEGLATVPEARVTALTVADGRVRAEAEDGRAWEAPVLVLALAPEQTGALLAGLDGGRDLASARALLALGRSQACLALLARYPEGAPVPDWDLWYPEDSTVLQVVSHDSAKRAAPARTALVLQAHPGWSRAHLEDPGWPDLLRAEAGRLLGPWAAAPESQHPHRWSRARSDRSAELSGPMLLDLPGGARLGLCGDRFAPGGGVEAAWRSGRRLAERILSTEAP